MASLIETQVTYSMIVTLSKKINGKNRPLDLRKVQKAQSTHKELARWLSNYALLREVVVNPRNKDLDGASFTPADLQVAHYLWSLLAD